MCRSCAISSLLLHKRGKMGMTHGFLWAALNSFHRVRLALPRIGIPLSNNGMGTQLILPAGFEMWMDEPSRSLQSIARTSDVLFAGSRNPASSCAPAMAVRTTKMEPAPLDLQSADCSNITTGLKAENC